MIDIPAAERQRIASAVELNEQYLYQCLTERREMRAELCTAVEQASNLVIRRWHLRPKDWHRIWPELIGQEGAPEVPAAPDVPPEKAAA